MKTLRYFNFQQNAIELCSLDPDWEYVSIGSDNDLVPDRRHAIIWSNDDLA